MKVMKKIITVLRVTACLSALAAIAGAQTPTAGTAANPNPELVGKLTKELNVTPKQAVGGAGAIFGLAKSKLDPAQFSQLAAAVPGMDKFLKAAPAAAPAGAGGSALGSLGSMAGGQAGGLASLAGSFQSLGLSPGMIGKFAPIMQNYIGAKGGSGVASMFAGVLK